MNINEVDLQFDGLEYDNHPQLIVVHHSEARECSILDVNRWHKEKGWSGCGYQYFVRKDGSIWRGRPENAQGAHARGYNTSSIGICAEGNYDIETMPDIQLNSIKCLIADIRSRWGNLEIKGHGEVNATACPGVNYPLSQVRDSNIQYTPEVHVESPFSQESQAIAEGKRYIGARCKELQQKLIQLGYNLGSYGADGDFGKMTYHALTQFQKDNGLIVDGLAGAQTFEKINGLLSQNNTQRPVTGPDRASYDYASLQRIIGVDADNIPGPITHRHCPTLEKGSKGEVVVWLQTFLTAHGYACGSIDGDFGSKTEAAVMAFQGVHGLSQDGEVGPLTWAAILGL